MNSCRTNAFIHTAKKVKEWFAEKGILLVIDWPAYSTGLNPIEHIWWHLKTRICEMFPDVAEDKSETEHVRQRLESCLQAAWDTLDKDLFDKLYQSMPVGSRHVSRQMAGTQNIKWKLAIFSNFFLRKL